MKVLFIQKDFFPRYGILCLASAARKAGHACELAITDLEDLRESALRFKPDVIALTLTSGEMEWAQKTARDIKSLLGDGTRVVVGGAHATMFPETVREPSFDFLLRGEADTTFPMLLDALEEGRSLERIPNLVYLGGTEAHHTPISPLPDPNKLPFPAYDLLLKYGVYGKMGFFYMRASRGCPYSCSFCYVASYKNLLYPDHSGFYRPRTPKSVMEEAKYARAMHPEMRFIRIEDDSLNISPPWLEEFLTLYKTEVGLPFDCHVRVDLVTEESAKLLKEAGCKAVKIGLETGSEERRNRVYAKQMAEKDIRRGVALLKKHGLRINFHNIVGGPAETIEEALHTYAMNLELGIDTADCHRLHIFPGAPFAEGNKEMSFAAPYFLYHKNGQAASNDAFNNLVCLFPLGVLLKMPPSVMARAVRLPSNRLFQALLWVGLSLGKVKLREMRGANYLDMLRSFAPTFFGLRSQKRI